MGGYRTDRNHSWHGGKGPASAGEKRAKVLESTTAVINNKQLYLIVDSFIYIYLTNDFTWVVSFESLNAATQALHCYFKNKETEAQKGLITYPHLTVQEQAKRMDGQQMRTMATCGGVWAPTGKGPESASWVGVR